MMKYQNQDSLKVTKMMESEFNTPQNISPASLKNVTKSNCFAEQDKSHFSTVCENASLIEKPDKDIERKKIMAYFLMNLGGKTPNLTLTNHFQ